MFLINNILIYLYKLNKFKMKNNKIDVVWATKKIGSQTFTRRFTAYAWRLMGNSGSEGNPPRNGWTQIPSEVSKSKTQSVVVPEANVKIEIDNKGEILSDKSKDEEIKILSTDETVIKAISHMKSLKTDSHLNSYAGQDNRSTIKKALEKMLLDFKNK